jgi:hypothetical protein
MEKIECSCNMYSGNTADAVKGYLSVVETMYLNGRVVATVWECNKCHQRFRLENNN